MLSLRQQIELAARCDAKVLILGETGVGKELVARAIHERSVRNTRPCVAVNCSGIPETLLESELFGHVRGSFTGAYRDNPGVIRQAHGGTLFLDELGEMSLRMQAVLLRFAERGEIQTVGSDALSSPSDVRLITATNRDLRGAVGRGEFRQDLYYRLNVIEIMIAPLRERRDDVLPLMRHYLDRTAASHRMPRPHLTSAAEAALVEYSWPGNVRELRNVAERLVVMGLGRPVTIDDLPLEVDPQRDARRSSLDDSSSSVESMWRRFAEHADFWTVVFEPFKRRELTRQQVMELIDSGLRRTGGNYRALIAAFNLPPTDYKRFHAFLTQHQCNLPVSAYRRSTERSGLRKPAAPQTVYGKSA